MKVGFFVYPGFQLLDLAGPMSAFEIAKRFHAAANYELSVVSLDGGSMVSSGGLPVETEAISEVCFDTLIVIGGDELGQVCECKQTRSALKMAAGQSRRVASICTGAIILASTGLLDGKVVTTHWRFVHDLVRKHPKVLTEPDRIYVRDGKYWSSAGITAGIDLALVLIEDDAGETLARKVAQDLVVFYRRPGGQSQYSTLLQVSGRSERIDLALAYARENLAKPLTVEDLAEHAHLSPRQFARVFREETGVTPAKAIEQLRVEAARIRVEDNSSESLEEICQTTGFGDLERMRRAFVRAFGMSPQALRRSARATS
jgi:transcriptional regulator GlxA family with amidase domain